MSFTPIIKPDDRKNSDIYINGLLAATRLGMRILLQDMPMMRPVTKEETDAHVYIFKDPTPDNKLYNLRKQARDTIAAQLAGIVRELFPDIEYIDQARGYQQEIVLQMTPEDVEEHTKVLAELAERVRDQADDDKKTA
jgi:hypothetical protein